MLKKAAVENILTAALESGADFAEIYAEETKRSNIAMVNGRVETALGGMDYGAGVRLFFGNQAIYGFTNDLSEENLIRIAREGAAALKGDRIYNVKGWKEMAARCINPIRILPDSIAKTAKAEQLRLASQAAKEFDALITQTRAGYLEVMDTGQALTRFFQRDSTKANNLTLYPNMEDEFWLWVSSWALFITKPSDVNSGYSDEGYVLPPLEVLSLIHI